MWLYVWLFEIPWTVALQAPLHMGFSRQEHWSGLPGPSPGDVSRAGIEPTSLVSPALVGRFFTTESPGKLKEICTIHIIKCFMIHDCNILNIPLHISKDINYTWYILFAILTLFLWILALLIIEFNGSLLQKCFSSNVWWDFAIWVPLFLRMPVVWSFLLQPDNRLLWRNVET